MRWILPLVLLAGEACGLLAEEFLRLVFERDEARARAFGRVSYRAELRYQEVDLLNNRVRSLGCVRAVRARGFGSQEYDFLRVNVDGAEVSGRQAERVCAELRRKGVFARRTRLPFFSESRADYFYEVLDDTVFSGRRVRRVRFVPRVRGEGYVKGVAWVLVGSGDVVRMEFAPAVLPLVAREARMVLDYGEVAGFWLPVRFGMRMLIVVAPLGLELVKMEIRAEEFYSDYQVLR